MTVKVLIADDHQIVCDGLRTLLEKQRGTEIVATVHDGRAAVRVTLEKRPDVVIMDVAMPDLNGIEASAMIRKACPEVKIIALSMHSDRRYVTGMLSAGVSGYLLKDCAFEELHHAISAVLSGKTYLSPGIAGVVVEEALRPRSGLAPQRGERSKLTAREREVLQLLAEGLTARKIAAKLHVSVKTVETHRRHVMEKTKVKSIAELTKFAIREGVTSLDS